MRADDRHRPNPAAAISWAAVERLAEWMKNNRSHDHGKTRPDDDFKTSGDPDRYIRSIGRHSVEFLKAAEECNAEVMEITACALMFNAMGYLHERAQLNDNRAENTPAETEFDNEAADEEWHPFDPFLPDTKYFKRTSVLDQGFMDLNQPLFWDHLGIPWVRK